MWALGASAQRAVTVPPPGTPSPTPTTPDLDTLPPPTRWQQHADSIFQYLDRTQVGTGLLTNYGYALKDYSQFQGTARMAANQLRSLAEWRLLYAALQTSLFNGNATLPSLVVANQRITQAQQAPATVSIATLLARYDRFRDDAGTAGLVTVSNRQLHDNPNRTFAFTLFQPGCDSVRITKGRFDKQL